MTMYIVPNHVGDEIDRRLDAELAKVPDAKADRETFRAQLVEHFARTGQFAEFSISKMEALND